MLKQLLFSAALAAVAFNASAEEPVFPETFDYTINGEKELAGVSIDFKSSAYGPYMYVNGTSDAESITLSFAVPEGWDGFIISAPFAEVTENSMVQTRGEYDWNPIDFFLTNLQYVKGNTVTFAVEEEDNYATLALYKGDQVYNTTLTIEYNVKPAGESGDPVFPEFIQYTTYDEGLEVWEGEEYGMFTIRVTGEASSDEFDLVLDVPEGWDGFISYDFSDQVKVSESEVGSKKTRSEESMWVPIDTYLSNGYVKGNKFTFKADGTEQDLSLYLYKGDMVDAANEISLENNEVTVGLGGYPDMPESIDVKVSCEGLEVTQAPTYVGWTPGYAINIDGETTEKQLTVTVAVPEGWDGIIGMTDQGIAPEVAPLNTRGNSEDLYWFPVEEFESEGFLPGNKFTFNIDGEEHGAQFFLVKGNQFVYYPYMLNINVTSGEAEVMPTEFPSLDDIKVTLSCEGPEVTVEQGYFPEIRVKGECFVDEFTVTVEVPEGWDGYYAYNNDRDNEATRSMTRAFEIDWQPVSDLIEEDFRIENSFTFKADGEKHSVMMYLYKGNYYDWNNMIDLQVKVTRSYSAVESIDAIDGNAVYYDVNGSKVANPSKGIYVKVVDGKTSKVVIK